MFMQLARGSCFADIFHILRCSYFCINSIWKIVFATYRPMTSRAVLWSKLVEGRYWIQFSVALVYLAVQSFPWFSPETRVNTDWDLLERPTRKAFPRRERSHMRIIGFNPTTFCNIFQRHDILLTRVHWYVTIFRIFWSIYTYPHTFGKILWKYSWNIYLKKLNWFNFGVCIWILDASVQHFQFFFRLLHYLMNWISLNLKSEMLITQARYP